MTNRKAAFAAFAVATTMVVAALFEDKRKGTHMRDQLDPVTPLDNPRQAIVDAAVSQLGVQNPSKYWDEVLPSAPGFHGDWCGGFALWAIHQGRVGRDVNWEIGKGFCYHLPITKTPLPGDVAYFDQPYQHHAIVEMVGNEMVTTIDGNQHGSTVQRKTRPIKAVTAFYSIQPLIDESYPAQA